MAAAAVTCARRLPRWLLPGHHHHHAPVSSLPRHSQCQLLPWPSQWQQRQHLPAGPKQRALVSAAYRLLVGHDVRGLHARLRLPGAGWQQGQGLGGGDGSLGEGDLILDPGGWIQVLDHHVRRVHNTWPSGSAHVNCLAVTADGAQLVSIERAGVRV